eukprot:468859_1
MPFAHGVSGFIFWCTLVSCNASFVSPQNQSTIHRLMNNYDVFSNDIIKPYLCAPRNLCKRMNVLVNSHQDYITTNAKIHIYDMRAKAIKKQYKIPDEITNHSDGVGLPSGSQLLWAYKNSFDCRGINDIDYMYLLWLKDEISTSRLIFSGNQEDIALLNDLKPNLYTKNTLSKLKLLHDTLDNNTNYSKVVGLWHFTYGSILDEIGGFSQPYLPSNEHWIGKIHGLWRDVLHTLRIKLCCHILNGTMDFDRNWHEHLSWMKVYNAVQQLPQFVPSVDVKAILTKLNTCLVAYQVLCGDLSMESSIPVDSDVEHVHTFPGRLSNISQMGVYFSGFKKEYHEHIVCRFESLISIANSGYKINMFEIHAIETIDALLVYGRKLSIYHCDDAVFPLMVNLLEEFKTATLNADTNGYLFLLNRISQYTSSFY